MGIFKLKSDYEPAGDQPRVIEELVNNLKRGVKYQVLLGVTGSGKTFTIANVIARIDKPVLVISHNKTLAAQLYNEFSAFFPENAVEYFISYYDYYQPEAYIPRTDTYIAKDSSINDEIDRLKQKTVMSLLTRRDVIVVASVSCIYGAGEKEDYSKLAFYINVGDKLSRKDILSTFVELLYTRNDINFERGTFRVRGDVIDIYPSYMRNLAIRIELFDDEVDRIVMFDPLTNRVVEERESVAIFPANFFITTKEKKERAIKSIKEELKERVEYFKSRGKLLEAQRIEERTNFDLEMIEQTGTCAGIENYSRHFSNRKPGEPPGTLIDYFGDGFLVIIDESHVTLPQLKGMYRGDYSRKKTLVDYGFRLPSALDNRPLRFEELMERWDQVIFVSATPDEFEINLSNGVVVEQIIRPTGLMEPPVEVRPMDNAVDDLYSEIKKATEKGGKVLITTLSKRMAEDLSEYYNELGLKTKYMHSELNAIERAKIISDLRNDKFDCIIGVNLLREGLDIPEVNLVAILDADKEGFLRSTTSLIQTSGRAARNAESKVIFYANKMTDSMKKAIDEIERRRRIQAEYNKKHGIEPKTIVKSKDNKMLQMCNLDYMDTLEGFDLQLKPKDIPKRIKQLQRLLKDAVKKMDFESAIKYRDEIEKLKKLDLEV
ncbi:excinuclease ABC subunit UvrB [Hippea sp. KM1]|uniref:excinuclease ABC subunit UvrB n=1 Tax=Hippea sp. KM1 TaxID=944481 RepID=UPI00046D8B20|nr:excinuclease ABC subunit UvrB [Hippea sp. KM1]